ncbi:hypothetical protein C8R42DRAFT_662652 [Lentinula raphanica]|nr:hypothetical protein C8R42DRAFT_692914 [Lentinula raphanica]KAJ3724805.1 hypothetical protein C8R42DRAFT_662652 [Lentinula raphanica]
MSGTINESLVGTSLRNQEGRNDHDLDATAAEKEPTGEIHCQNSNMYWTTHLIPSFLPLQIQCIY